MDVRTVLLCDVCWAMLLLLLRSARGHGGHAHAPVSPEDRPTGFHDPKIVQDADHIKEHYEGLANFNETEMSPEELEFHYFKLHDFDNNTKLDGLEIYKALTHLLPYDPEEHAAAADTAEAGGRSADDLRDAQTKYYTDIVDGVLDEDDINRDGYLTYAEYVLARRREEARERLEQVKERARQREP